MTAPSVKSENDEWVKLKWLMSFRVLFATLLLGSTIFFRLRESYSFTDWPLLFVYILTAGILLLSLFYASLFKYIKNASRFAFVQLGIDTAIVTLILFITGSFSSIFTFLYLVVIICSSMFLSRKGCLIIATVCAVQYALMVFFEYYGRIKPFGMEENLLIENYSLSYVLFKTVATASACFLVAILSSVLAEQERKSRQELLLMEKNIKRVEKMAAVGEMAAGLAHEIKNPLASLSGSIQMLREELQYDPDQDKLMQIIIREANRLSSLVNEFLLFARPQQGRVEAMQLDKALNEIVDLFKQDCSFRKRISFFKEFAPEIYIEMDPGHLRQVLWNLLLNAAEAIEDTGQIEVKMYPSGNQHVYIKIIDDGCGMSEKTMQSIFDPFFTTKKRGTGLGLSIVHRLLESYNCQMDVKSEIGKGTTFFLKLNRIQKPQK